MKDPAAQLHAYFDGTFSERGRDGRFVSQARVKKAALHQQMREHFRAQMQIAELPLAQPRYQAIHPRRRELPKAPRRIWPVIVGILAEMPSGLIATGLLIAAGWP